MAIIILRDLNDSHVNRQISLSISRRMHENVYILHSDIFVYISLIPYASTKFYNPLTVASDDATYVFCIPSGTNIHMPASLMWLQKQQYSGSRYPSISRMLLYSFLSQATYPVSVFALSVSVTPPQAIGQLMYNNNNIVRLFRTRRIDNVFYYAIASFLLIFSQTRHVVSTTF